MRHYMVITIQHLTNIHVTSLQSDEILHMQAVQGISKGATRAK